MSANQTTRLDPSLSSFEFLYEPETLEVLRRAADSFVKHRNGTVEL